MSLIKSAQAKTKKPSNNVIIRQANVLTSAAYSLTKTEKRIVYLALDSITKNNPKPNKFGQYPVDIVHSVFSDTFNSSASNTSRDIANAAKTLNTKEVIFYLPEEDTEEEKALDGISWTTKRAHRPKKGMTTIHFNSELISIIMAVKDNFTRLLMEDIIKLDNAGSLRLYDSLMQWKKRGEVTFQLAWMINRYELSPKYLDRLSDFRRRFLLPAIKEINEKTSINVQHFELTGKERKNKVYAIKFVITPKELIELKPIESKKTALEQAVETYLAFVDKLYLPSEEDIANLKNHIGQLVLEGFEFTPELIASINEASSVNKEL